MVIRSVTWSVNKILIALLITFVFLSAFHQKVATATLFRSEYNNRIAGRPRFSKKETVMMYFGLGIGMSPLDKIVDFDSMQLPSSIIADLQDPRYGVSSSASFTGVPSVSFGFIPSSAKFLRNNIEVSFHLGDFANKVTSSNIATIDGIEYESLNLKVFTTRALYELYLQFGPKKAKWSTFIGGGAGIASQINSLKGSEKQVSSGTTAGEGTEVNIASNYSSFALTFSGAGGFTFDVLPGLAMEIKCRYVAMMSPFDSTSGQFDIYRNNVEILASILVKM
ncbi:MAG: hypothetical protein JJW01_02965 [Alphaproteobacteria bacterium]|nr:hypothetical protein [Rickettsiales bacterium]